ncbi:phosphohydrolase [Sulfuricaulis limicola]|uniref:Phosphohydrolase n=1 Tax=Sulfuricaulis limicola TaxID=1620215 RepID=A0A1B4XIN5_9GAMM|nr:HD-GYP domain-containing protein [Sulfuricaulis limicola]BAV34667.1 phosphohydrolase [Sulfuricaulis limicola]
MIVRIDTQQLRIGMYVCELDRPWRETPFMFQGFEIRTDEELKTLQQYCRTVFIIANDAEGMALAKRAPARPELLKTTADLASGMKPAISIEQEMLKLNNHPGARSVYADETTLEEEIRNIKDIHAGACQLIQDLMWEAKFGRSLDVPGARQTISHMVQSALRNPDALTCFAQLKNKDEYTAQHSLRVAILSLVFGRQLGLTPAELEMLGLGALLLDVGKMKIPSEILNKPAALTGDEFALVRQHVPWGIEILEKASQVPTMALEVARRHHERYDGSGYGDHLRGDTIGTFGMIAGVLDFYDAVTSDRVYRAGITAHAAMKKLYEGRGTLFHPELTEKFIQCLGIYPIGSVVELNTGEIGVVAALNRTQRLKPRVVLVQRADKSPYPDMPVVSLAGRKNPDGRACEIERVLDPAECGIDPSRYLPLTGAA